MKFTNIASVKFTNIASVKFTNIASVKFTNIASVKFTNIASVSIQNRSCLQVQQHCSIYTVAFAFKICITSMIYYQWDHYKCQNKSKKLIMYFSPASPIKNVNRKWRQRLNLAHSCRVTIQLLPFDLPNLNQTNRVKFHTQIHAVFSWWCDRSLLKWNTILRKTINKNRYFTAKLYHWKNVQKPWSGFDRPTWYANEEVYRLNCCAIYLKWIPSRQVFSLLHLHWPNW